MSFKNQFEKIGKKVRRVKFHLSRFFPFCRFIRKCFLGNISCLNLKMSIQTTYTIKRKNVVKKKELLEYSKVSALALEILVQRGIFRKHFLKYDFTEIVFNKNRLIKNLCYITFLAHSSKGAITGATRRGPQQRALSRT